MKIKENIAKIREEISSVCEKIGRNPEDIKLIAVSKTRSIDEINEVLDSGCLDCAENKAQELRDKAPLIQKDINWHFIGHLQTNKVKYVVETSALIHSVDSLKIAKEIEKRAEAVNKIQNILLEIKTSEEESKFGLYKEDEIFEIADFCKGSSNVKLIGLMTMAPFVDDDSIIRKSFRKLKELFDKMNNKGYALTELSMGMSGDFHIAIEEGSTMVRIGTSIFGERDYTK
ncbi:MAG: YggS family pyridoxal phosphate-dependent enzyme [Melioribacteraceae bacterium]|nr:YggS family pyridoxal phosphate-dependent enzyme [Melioribacteraceae bacterium]